MKREGIGGRADEGEVEEERRKQLFGLMQQLTESGVWE